MTTTEKTVSFGDIEDGTEQNTVLGDEKIIGFRFDMEDIAAGEKEKHEYYQFIQALIYTPDADAVAIASPDAVA